MVSEQEPELARRRLRGSRNTKRSRQARAPERPVVARAGPATLRDCGGSGAPAVLVPSLINPPDILDLDETVRSPTRSRRWGGMRCCSIGGRPGERASLDLGAHVDRSIAAAAARARRATGADRLLPRRDDGDRCRQSRRGRARRDPRGAVALLRLPADSRNSLASAVGNDQARGPASWTRFRWRCFRAPSGRSTRSAPWPSSPSFAEFQPGSARAHRFVTLEDWANEGEPLPYPAARELIEDLFGGDLPGSGGWRVGGESSPTELSVPAPQHHRLRRPDHARADGTRRRPRSRSIPAMSA